MRTGPASKTMNGKPASKPGNNPPSKPGTPPRAPPLELVPAPKLLEVPTHEPAEHVPPAWAQSSHAAPDAPHIVFEVPLWQVSVVSQHPLQSLHAPVGAWLEPGEPVEPPLLDSEMPPSDPAPPFLPFEPPQAPIVAND